MFGGVALTGKGHVKDLRMEGKVRLDGDEGFDGVHLSVHVLVCLWNGTCYLFHTCVDVIGSFSSMPPRNWTCIQCVIPCRQRGIHEGVLLDLVCILKPPRALFLHVVKKRSLRRLIARLMA